MSDQRRRGRAWKPDATGKRCVRCARTWDGHAATSCYPVPDPAIDAFDPPRPELLELGDGDDASRRTSPSRPGDPVDERDGSLADTRDGSAVDERDASVVSRVDALQTSRLAGAPGRFAYADPPYPGCAHYYDERRPGRQADVGRDASRAATAGPRDRS